MTIPGSATRRMLQRSIIQPNIGTISALITPPKDSAKEAVPRSQPISAINGFRNTPKVKAMTGPLQTTRPVTAPATTHQGLVNLIATASSPRAVGLWHPVAFDLSARGKAAERQIGVAKAKPRPKGRGLDRWCEGAGQ